MAAREETLEQLLGHVGGDERRDDDRPRAGERATAAVRACDGRAHDRRERHQTERCDERQQHVEVRVALPGQRVAGVVAVADRVAQLMHGRRSCCEQRDRAHGERTCPHRRGCYVAALLFRAVRALRWTLVPALLLLAIVPAARANGDPASDLLLGSKIYFPNQRVSVAEANRLKAVVQAANVKGYTIRVALIKDPSDLGVVPDLLNQAQQYANFLGPEIRFAYRGDLLVVMP